MKNGQILRKSTACN